MLFRSAVPVFWIATEDHDFDEVSNAFAVSKEGKLIEARFNASSSEVGRPVGVIDVDDSITDVIDVWLGDLPTTEFSRDLRELLGSAYYNGSSFGASFGKLLAVLMGKYGLILFDPLEPRAKRLASPIYRSAIKRSGEMIESLIARGRELESAGYHAQVLIEEDHVPLFWHASSRPGRAQTAYQHR